MVSAAQRSAQSTAGVWTESGEINACPYTLEELLQASELTGESELGVPCPGCVRRLWKALRLKDYSNYVSNPGKGLLQK